MKRKKSTPARSLRVYTAHFCFAFFPSLIFLPCSSFFFFNSFSGPLYALGAGHCKLVGSLPVGLEYGAQRSGCYLPLFLPHLWFLQWMSLCLQLFLGNLVLPCSPSSCSLRPSSDKTLLLLLDIGYLNLHYWFFQFFLNHSEYALN